MRDQNKMSESVFILCEGPSEKHMIDILIAAEMLKYYAPDLEGLEPLHVRAASDFERDYLDGQMDNIVIYRIIDSKSKGNLNFKLSKAYQDKAKIINCVTSPEIEMLYIIAGGKYNEYTRKFKSSMSPKQYVSSKMKIRKPNTRDAIYSYFSDPTLLRFAILEYKRVSNNPKHVKSIAELLKNNGE